MSEIRYSEDGREEKYKIGQELMATTIIPGVTREWDEKLRIGIYKFTAVNAPVLSTLGGHIVEGLQDWPTDEPFLLAYELTNLGVSMPYLVFNNYQIDNVVVLPQHKNQIDQIMDQRQDLIIGLALVLPNTMSGRITLGRGQNKLHMRSRMLFNAFFSLESALSWLAGIRQGNGATSIGSV